MRNNKINNVDLFTQRANEQYDKHIKTQSKRSLEIINEKINWKELLKPLETKSEQEKKNLSKARRKKLEEEGIFGGILKKGYKNKTLTKEERKLNRILSSIRNKVERPFAYMKRILSYTRYRYYDFLRNQFELAYCKQVYP